MDSVSTDSYRSKFDLKGVLAIDTLFVEQIGFKIVCVTTVVDVITVVIVSVVVVAVFVTVVVTFVSISTEVV